MKLAGGVKFAAIRPGDVVEINDGLPFLAVVREEREGRLVVQPLARVRKFRPRPAKPREIVCHWPHGAGESLLVSEVRR